MRLPLLARTVLAFCAGAAVALYAPGIPARPALAAAVALAAAAAARRTHGAALAAFAVVGLAAGAAGVAGAAGDCRSRIPDGALLRVRGTLAARPRPGKAVRIRLDRLASEESGDRWVDCDGSVRARLRAGATPPAPGTPFAGRGRWWAFLDGGAAPRRPEWAGTLVLDSVAPVRTHVDGARHPVLAVRGAIQGRLRRLFGERAGLVEALLLARRSGLDTEIRDRFVDAGLAHVLAISGLHVGLIAGALLLIGSILRLPVRVAAIAAATATVAYVAFLGAPHAASRAVLQIVLLLGARLTQRPTHPFAVLAAAALLLLARDPLALAAPGFQLSFAGTAGILALRPPLLRALPARGPRALRDGLAVSLAATAATAPVAAAHFGRVAPIGIVANFIAVPIVGVLVPALALTLAASFVSWPAAGFLAGAGDLLLRALDVVARGAAAVPGGSVYVAADSVWGWGVAAVGAGIVIRRTRGWSMGARRIAVVALAASVCIAWPVAVRRASTGALEIHAIDVGQGDAFALRSPEGRWILVDAGPRTDGYDAGRARVVPFLLERGVRRIDALVLTHPDGDHIGGARSVLDAFEVDAVIDPVFAAGKQQYLSLLRQARRSGIRWFAARPGRELRWGDVTIRLLQPERGVLDEADGANNVSVVFRMDFGRFAALFLGDAPAAAERRLVERYDGALRSDVLKVGHHGSATSTTDALLETAAPAVALISVGRRNRYGHPDVEVLRRLRRHEVEVLRTDRHGAITLRAWPDGRMNIRTTR